MLILALFNVALDFQFIQDAVNIAASRSRPLSHYSESAIVLFCLPQTVLLGELIMS